MAAQEALARQQEIHFQYLSEEVSDRTGGHRWLSKVIETEDGALQRLVAVDGRPLTTAQERFERKRIQQLVADPRTFRLENQNHRKDEETAQGLLKILPRAFVITPEGRRGDCMIFSFQPDPRFRPSSYEERFVTAMVGSVSIQMRESRLCSLEASLLRSVQFGFGVLGSVQAGGHFAITRSEIDDSHWKSNRISVHFRGRVLLLKSLTLEQEITRSNIHAVPKLTLAEAAGRLLK